MRVETSHTAYIEAGVTSYNVRASRRWFQFSVGFHLLLLFAVVLPYGAVLAPKPADKTRTVFDPIDLKLTPTKSVSAPAPPPAPKLTSPMHAPAKPPEPEAPVLPPIDQGEVNALDAHLIYLDQDLRQLEAVLQRTDGCVAFGPPLPDTAKPDTVPFFSDKFCVPGWQDKAPSGGRESAGGYFAIRLDQKFSFVNQLRATHHVPTSHLAYAVFNKNLRTLVNLLIMKASAARGIKSPSEVVVRFDAASDEGFEVVKVTNGNSGVGPGNGAAP